MAGLTPVCLNKGVSQGVWGILDVVNSMRFHLSLHFFCSMSELEESRNIP